MQERKIVLVTGATGGLGRAVSLTLAERGFEVWLGCLNRLTDANVLRDEIRKLNQAAEVVQFNVAEYEDCQATLASLQTERGAPSAFVHCAGYLHKSLLMRTDTVAWRRTLDINLSGFYNVCRSVLKGMIMQHDGSIVALGSVIGRRGLEGQAAYAASKSGLIGLVRSLAREVGGYNVRVNIVSPGWIAAGMNAGQSAELLQSRIPLRRPGTPQEVAHLIAFLCSPDASYITGADIPVSGGLDM